MSTRAASVDCIYICTGGNDARYIRTCVASIRYFYPHVPVRLLVSGKLQRGLREELRRYWDVDLGDIAEGEYGWGFTHLEPLFRPPGERFLVVDSDTVITGPVLKYAAEHDEDFLVDDEIQSPEGARTNYYDCAKAAEEGAPLRSPAFLFNAGEWFGKSGLLTREEFNGLIEWKFPRKLCRPNVFRAGDQGVFNYVINEHCATGRIRVARIPLMLWPGHGMRGLDAKAVATRSAPPLVIHWAGLKKPRLREMIGGDILAFFENVYYRRVPGGIVRKTIAGIRHTVSEWAGAVWVRVILTRRKLVARQPA